MDQARLKYRIVGGIVLVALAAILVPVLNDMRQPLPQGPLAIDIPAEPTDGLASRLPVDAPPLEGSLPEPEDIPRPYRRHRSAKTPTFCRRMRAPTLRPPPRRCRPGRPFR